MEEKSLSKPTMVSRLPKFGARPAPGVSSPLPNGPPQPPPSTQEGKTPPPGRANGLLRTSSFSLKWRKDGVGTSPEDGGGLEGREDKPQVQLPLLGKEGKKASPLTPKLQRSVSSVCSSPKAIPMQQASKASPKMGTRMGHSPLCGGLKVGLNGSFGSRRSGSGSCLVTSSSPHSGSRDSLSQSSDSLKSLALDNMVRSQSFTHFKQIPSPTSLPMTRSFSFNRAVELAKPLANTQLRTPRATLIKPPQGLANGRGGLGLGGMGGMGSVGSLGGLQYGRVGSSPLLSTPTPPSGLKKPLIPSCVLSKPSALGCRLARPGQARLQKPLFPGLAKGAEVRAGAGCVVGDVGYPPDKADSPPVTPDTPIDSERSRSLRDVLSQSCTAEGLEDMSLSSASSLERNDTSDEFLDDSDSLGDHGQGEVPDNRSRSNATEIRLRHFLNETMDWEGTCLTGGQEEEGERGSGGGLSSEEGDLPQGSSLELSPSNSSGGTYMWDEEGLEPLGGPASHPCDSYDDANLNSMDILNQLSSMDPGDLEEDDLMLDVDLPDDGSLHTDADGMTHLERSERGGRQGHWRRRQQRWNGPEHFHHDDRAPVCQQYDGLGAPGSMRPGPRPLPPVGRADRNVRALDQLALRHMAQDCTSVKNQLLKLKSLLQMEGGGAVVPHVEEDSEDDPTNLQMEELMQEVLSLREELRLKDKTIAQLTHQQLLKQEVSVQKQERRRCVCHQRSPSLRGGDRRTQHDKATQTPWRGGHTHGPPVLQSSSPCLRERLHHQGRLARTAPTEVPSDSQPSPSVERGARTHSACPGGPPPPDPDELSLLLSTQLHLHDQDGSGASQEGSAASSPAQGALSGLEGERKAPAGASVQELGSGSVASCPRILQPPRLYKRVSIPALLQGGSALTTGPAGPRASHMVTQQLPPPSRGLPCFNSPPQGLGLDRHLKYRMLPGPGRGSDPGVEEPDLPPSGQGPQPLVLSLLPKPKIHSPARLATAENLSVPTVHTHQTG